MFDYRSKIITAEQAVGLVRDGFNITVGLGANEPVAFLSNLHHIAGKVKDVTITNCLPTVIAPYLSEENVRASFWIDSWFSTPQLRSLAATGRVSFIPNHLHLAGIKRNFHRKSDILISMASMPEESGRVRFGAGNTYEEKIAGEADIVILEISPNVPHVLGQDYLNWDEIDYVIESDAFLGTIPIPQSNARDLAIGRSIADLIHDGDCVQVGIGGIPNAVCQYLSEKKDLGVHTEMMTTGIMELMKSGSVNGSRKQQDIGKVVCAFALGTQEMYAYMNDNPDIFVGRGELVNDPYVIAGNDNQVSINTTVEVDLTGQCCSESIGTLQISGTGGQSDTAVGAQISKNGRSVIALYSTVEKKNAETGDAEVLSKIVPTLRPGAAVSLSRNDVDWVVTEYGAVSLRGTTVRERAQRLISVAHPEFRDSLLSDARKYGFLL
ncbi:MAG: 4-hydroxybutyrate--acetyl-CoA CoA transferase [Clostridiales Family XIII bacterium]|nr:4-hydroxybutyrate--acetyl-CoA CoA transferase [Clostridiales Family XIII bacterium]